MFGVEEMFFGKYFPIFLCLIDQNIWKTFSIGMRKMSPLIEERKISCISIVPSLLSRPHSPNPPNSHS